ncbi:MAG TPA: efflux RND transporter periplasmic adaptor subunit [Chitinophagaceae bacterium]|nr:efflux RND transporter periplasmic adaptor subunit [Chitinophagaceae bacterium]
MKYSLIFIVSLVALVSCSENKGASVKNEKKDPPPQFQFATIEKGGVATTVKLPAQLAAYEEVSIFPKVNGYVKTVLVDIGSKVSAGDLLMTLEDPELEQASSQARERFERAKADFSIDKEKYQRLLEASRTAGAISPLDISAIKAKADADSALCNAEKANWQMQQTMLAYLKVTAPFSGVITERNVNPGALVSAAEKDKPMLELKQMSHLRLQVDVPEDIAPTLKDKDSVSFYVDAFPGKKMAGTISRKSDNMNVQYRSERIEIDVQNKDGMLTPGMYADVELHPQGNPDALNVPKSAVVTSTERKYVIVIRDNKTVQVDVQTGNQSGNTIEIFGSAKPGEKVIANPNDEIKSGVAVTF